MTAGVLGAHSGGSHPLGLAALRTAARRLRRGATVGDVAPPHPEHPLRVGAVMQRAGLGSLPSDDHAYRTVCPTCGSAQTLAQATLEPAAADGGITAYRCRNGCTVLATTGYPKSLPRGAGWRVTAGEFVITALVPAGLQFTTGTAEA